MKDEEFNGKPGFLASECPIVIFYERHDDKASGATMRSSLPYLYRMGMKIGALEFTYEVKLQELLEKLIDRSQFYHMAASSSAPIPSTFKYADTHEGLLEFAKAVDAKKEILEYIKQNQMSYQGIDIDDSMNANFTNEEERSVFSSIAMAAILKLVCSTHRSGATVLVGMNHYMIETILRKDGFPVQSFYVTSLPPLADRFYPDKTSPRLDDDVRDSNSKFRKEHETLCVINAHLDPNIDVTNIAKAVLEKFFASQAFNQNAASNSK